MWPSREGEGLDAWEWWVLWVAARPLGRALQHDEMQSNRPGVKSLLLVWRQTEVLLGRQVWAPPASEPLAWEVWELAREMMGQDARSWELALGKKREHDRILVSTSAVLVK